MNRSQETRAVFAGKLRGSVVQGVSVRDGLGGQASSSHTVRFDESIRCTQATSARQLSAAQQFWIHRYREAGLEAGMGRRQSQTFVAQRFEETLAAQESVDPVVTRDADSQVSNWRPVTYLAYRTGTRTIRTDRSKSAADADSQDASGRLTVRREPVEQLCGTVTLLIPATEHDQQQGGPSSLAGHQRADHKIARITRLAVDHEPFASGNTPIGYRTVFLTLTSYMHRAALSLGVTHLDAIVHPRHAKLYRRIFNAVPIGDPFACEDVGGSPGQYMRADITHPNRFHSRLRTSYQRPQQSHKAGA